MKNLDTCYYIHNKLLFHNTSQPSLSGHFLFEYSFCTTMTDRFLPEVIKENLKFGAQIFKKTVVLGFCDRISLSTLKFFFF